MKSDSYDVGQSFSLQICKLPKDLFKANTLQWRNKICHLPPWDEINSLLVHFLERVALPGFINLIESNQQQELDAVTHSTYVSRSKRLQNETATGINSAAADFPEGNYSDGSTLSTLKEIKLHV